MSVSATSTSTAYVISHEREDLDKTLEYYERAYGIEPESPETNAGLGWAYFLRGDNDGAFSFFKRAFDFGPENPSIAADVGSFFRSIGLPGKAVKFYTHAIDRGGFYSAASSGGAIDEIHRLRATCYERLGETDQGCRRRQDVARAGARQHRRRALPRPHADRSKKPERGRTGNRRRRKSGPRQPQPQIHPGAPLRGARRQGQGSASHRGGQEGPRLFTAIFSPGFTRAVGSRTTPSRSSGSGSTGGSGTP